ncbi:MAG TPA: HAMP domain-containing sensor histidine kinase [Thermoanaerobaculia bacterium]|nr:HAMP domain-containing sensor histidine kinase [Thermoanaerobaculia bacterium]
MKDHATAVHGDSVEDRVAERILVLAPTGDDALLVSRILEERGLDTVVVPDLTELTRELLAGAGAVLIASEAIDNVESSSILQEVLERQDTWSEMPILLFGGSVEDAASRATEQLGMRAQIVLLERPLGIATFVTATEAALRSRRRQYLVKHLLDELAASAVKIERVHDDANRAKDEFIATLAHELRSPMTAILGWIQMLKMDDLDPADAASALSMLESATKVQSHIVEDLMDVSRILAGKVMVEPEVVELGPLVENMVATFRPGAAAQGIELTADVAAEPLMAWADGSRLQQVGWNLISNAIKFTPHGGSVRVSLAREGDQGVIRVRDSGQGLPRELLDHVFERYRQGDGGAKSARGLGLGLAIVHHLVVSHGGTVEAFSDGPGKGAEFVVTLPLHKPSAV